MSHGLNADFDDWVLENRAGNIGWGGVLSEVGVQEAGGGEEVYF